MLPGSLTFSNFESRRRFQISGTASSGAIAHNCEMPNQAPDWYLQEWMKHFGKIQADLSKELGWDKARANFIYHGKQPYKREVLNEVAAWLGVDPYELLMPPTKALAIRELYRSAERIVQGQASAELNPEGDRFLPGSQTSSKKPRRDGTRG